MTFQVPSVPSSIIFSLPYSMLWPLLLFLCDEMYNERWGVSLPVRTVRQYFTYQDPKVNVISFSLFNFGTGDLWNDASTCAIIFLRV